MYNTSVLDCIIFIRRVHKKEATCFCFTVALKVTNKFPSNLASSFINEYLTVWYKTMSTSPTYPRT